MIGLNEIMKRIFYTTCLLYLQDLLDEMESTRRMVRDNTEYIKRINQIAATGATGGNFFNHNNEITRPVS